MLDLADLDMQRKMTGARGGRTIEIAFHKKICMKGNPRAKRRRGCNLEHPPTDLTSPRDESELINLLQMGSALSSAVVSSVMNDTNYLQVGGPRQTSSACSACGRGEWRMMARGGQHVAVAL